MTRDDDARVADLLARLGDGDSRDLFRRLLEQGMQDLIDAELTAAIGAAPHERIETRSNQRNGSRSRLLSTPAGDVELRIPKVRVGSFPVAARATPASGQGPVGGDHDRVHHWDLDAEGR